MNLNSTQTRRVDWHGFPAPLIIDGTTENSPGSFVAGVAASTSSSSATLCRGRTGYDLTVTQAISAGLGNIFIQTANEGGHNILVSGQVYTGSGSIEIDADDNIALATATIGGTYNSTAFSGTVTIHTNLDTGNSQALTMDSKSSISTTNTTANAVVIEQFVTANGVLQFSNISVGNGGGITLNASANSLTQSAAMGCRR